MNEVVGVSRSLFEAVYQFCAGSRDTQWLRFSVYLVGLRRASRSGINFDQRQVWCVGILFLSFCIVARNWEPVQVWQCWSTMRINCSDEGYSRKRRSEDDARKESAVSQQPPMLLVEHAECTTLCIFRCLEGTTSAISSERYLCAESRWDALLPLLTTWHSLSRVASSLYALGVGLSISLKLGADAELETPL
jgi:hypothetical protein